MAKGADLVVHALVGSGRARQSVAAAGADANQYRRAMSMGRWYTAEPGTRHTPAVGPARAGARSHTVATGSRRPAQPLAERGAPIPGSTWCGPEADGRTSKSKIAVGM